MLENTYDILVHIGLERLLSAVIQNLMYFPAIVSAICNHTSTFLPDRAASLTIFQMEVPLFDLGIVYMCNNPAP